MNRKRTKVNKCHEEKLIVTHELISHCHLLCTIRKRKFQISCISVQILSKAGYNWLPGMNNKQHIWNAVEHSHISGLFAIAQKRSVCTISAVQCGFVHSTMIYYQQSLDHFRRTTFFHFTVLSIVWIFILPALAVCSWQLTEPARGYMGSWHRPKQEMALLSLLLQTGCQCVNFCSRGLASAQDWGEGKSRNRRRRSAHHCAVHFKINWGKPFSIMPLFYRNIRRRNLKPDPENYQVQGFGITAPESVRRGDNLIYSNNNNSNNNKTATGWCVMNIHLRPSLYPPLFYFFLSFHSSGVPVFSSRELQGWALKPPLCFH